jgi:hypothetical protein
MVQTLLSHTNECLKINKMFWSLYKKPHFTVNSEIPSYRRDNLPLYAHWKNGVHYNTLCDGAYHPEYRTKQLLG